MYNENYKKLLKGIKENLNKWKHVPCSWTGRLNIVKMSIVPKVMCRFNAIPFKNPSSSFCRIRNTHRKIHMKFHANLNSQNDPKKKNKIREFTLPDFKT